MISTGRRETQAEAKTRPPRLIAVMPAYNEESSVIGVLERLEPLVDEIVVVDDGSTDRTAQIIFDWTEGRANVQPIFLPNNRGMSYAYYEAFRELAARVGRGELSADDIILTIDADGQHEPEEIQALMSRLAEGGYDAVIARRDLSRYPKYKRFGNWVMSLWASLWAGQRLYDVESGFRVFRVGAILAALRYYKGYRYSETVEVAVLLPHLGYRVCNDLLLPVPVIRSRTRMSDALIDIAAMPAAWWRLFATRDLPRDVPSRLKFVLPTLPLLVLLFMVVDLLIRPIFLADDSMQNYAHVWYLSQQLFDHGHVPLRMAVLDSGHAVTFPYAFTPYMVGALLFRVFGDWSVSLMMAIAVLGTVWSAMLVRPVMRNPWFLLVFVANPFFIDAVFAFQFPTIWSTLFFFLFVWAFERKRYVVGGALLWLTVSTHPIIGGAAAGTYGLYLVAFDRPKVRPLALLSVPVGLALVPFYWMMLLTPAVHENSLRTIFFSVLDVFPRRGSVLLMPFALTVLAPYVRRYYRVSLAIAMTAAVLGIVAATGPLNQVHGSYYGAIHGSSDIYAGFFSSPAFEHGATYRVLEPNEREDGMYYFLRHGAVLSNEFFSESIFRRSWTESQYGCFTSSKGVDYVAIEQEYTLDYHTNESALLQALVRDARAAVVYRDPGQRFTVYDVRRFVAEQQKPSSLKDCVLA